MSHQPMIKQIETDTAIRQQFDTIFCFPRITVAWSWAFNRIYITVKDIERMLIYKSLG